MSTHVVESSPNGITIQITVSFGISMLDFETQLQQQLNEAGNLATSISRLTGARRFAPSSARRGSS